MNKCEKCVYYRAKENRNYNEPKNGNCIINPPVVLVTPRVTGTIKTWANPSGSFYDDGGNIVTRFPEVLAIQECGKFKGIDNEHNPQTKD